MCHRLKKGILVVSYGTSSEDVRRSNIETIEDRIREVFSNYELRSAFTSSLVINRLKENNILIDSPDDALLKMKDEGFQEVIIQPLQIIPGLEYEKICTLYNENIINFKRIGLGKPILYDIRSYKEAINSLKSQLSELLSKSAIVLVGHGSNHPANACYSCLQSFLNDENLNVFVGTIGGYPDINNIIKKLKDNKVKEIILMPYMITTGKHVQNDIFSDNEKAWKTVIEKEGITVNIYPHGLGENVDYQNIFVSRVKETIETINCDTRKTNKGMYNKKNKRIYT